MPWMNRFPVLPIGRYDPMLSNLILRQASPVNTITIRVAPRYVQRTDTAGLAKPVLCCTSVERVFGKVVFSFERLKA